jgi:hypothetical protein
MPHFYFHLSNSGEYIRDSVGSDVSDLAAAHCRALQLANRVIGFSCLADRKPDWRRWTVRVTDQSQQPVVTLIFSACYMPEKRTANTEIKGARALQQRLGDMLDERNATLDVSRRKWA